MRQGGRITDRSAVASVFKKHATSHIKPSRKAGYPRKVANLTEQPKMAKTAVIMTNFHFIVSYAIAILYGIYPLATISGPKLTRLALVGIGP